jgi:hypothetical protein
MAQKISERLVDRLRTELKVDLPDGTVAQRLYPGRHQRACGAWVWSLWHPDTKFCAVGCIGSIYPMKDIVTAHSIVGQTNGWDFEIYPLTEREK